MIHPTAVIASGAKIGSNVEIGPHSFVGGAVSIGDNSIIGANVVLEGEVIVRHENRIAHGTVIGGEPQDLTFAPTTRSRVEIGAKNVIREHCTIHRGTAEGSATKIGDENFLMAGAHLGHNCEIGNKVIIANNCLLGGYVSVADGAFLGGGCVFHQFIRVGRFAITQGASAFSKDIPPFVIAAERNYVFGLNTVGLRRAGFSSAQRDEIKRAFKLLYLSGLNTRQALERSKEMQWTDVGHEFFRFVGDAIGKRAICPLKRGGAGRGGSPEPRPGD
jgi:UDP-N-acetylglucosamine acyltransferase